MKQSYETQAILNDARIGVNKIYISKEVREENCEEIYSLIVNDECIIPKEYWLTVISNSGEETTKKGTGDIWSKCIPLSGGGGVLSVTGSLVSGTPENPIIGDYNNVIVQNGDIVDINQYSGTLRLYANEHIEVLNIDWNELSVDTKTITIQFAFDCDDIVNTTSTGSTLERLPSKCKDLDVWQVIYTNAPDTWVLETINTEYVPTGVESVTGNLVDNSDPRNPIVNSYVERVGYLNLSNGSNFSLYSSADVTKILSSSSPTGLTNVTMQFPKLDDEIYKRVIIFSVDVETVNHSIGSGVTVTNVPNQAKKGDCWTIIYDKFDFAWDLVSINSMPKWYIDNIYPTGTERQVAGWNQSGGKSAITIGWKQLSDMTAPPTFNTGVLSGTTFDADGTAMFYFHELNDAVGASAKASTIPVYTTLGRLKVGNAVNTDEAMSLGQLNAMVSDAVSGSTIAKREQDGTIAVAYAGEEYSAVPLRQMLEFAGTTVVRPTVGSTTVIPIGAKGKYIVVYSGTGGVANIDLGIADLLNNEGLEIVVVNKSDDGGVVLRSFSGQTQILPDAGGVLVASTTIGAGSTQNFICDGIHVIGI